MSPRNQTVRSGLPDGIFLNPKDPKLDKFLRAFELIMLAYFRVICNILEPFGIFYDH
jgi:hypothetical protein